MDKHDLISALMELASQLGRTPTRLEFMATMKGAQYKIEKLYGNYTVLLQAAGLDTYNERRKINDTVFERPIEDHIKRYEPREALKQEPYDTLATISDIHWPFASSRVVKIFIEYVGDVKPKWVILNGDAWDMYSHAKFPRSHNIFTPREEERYSRQMNEEFWKSIQKVHPESQCVQMIGNHDVRPLKRVLENYPAAEDWVAEAFKKNFSFEGVKTIFDPREELYLPGNVLVFHGYKSKLGEHRDHTLMNTINGHTHRGGVVFRSIRGTVLWELNSGLAGDPEAKGLTYTSQRITGWTPGFAAVDKLGPRFIPV